ncbi:MAG: methylated-DNA--[protein]-cysteine S-methyltransferase [Gemmatimonadales bacterium]|nr:methylated-DNA--[protein]-cysteine S-methyltransferase [Gemmatimonadales bacterium]
MHDIAWTTWRSPIGLLTVVEGEGSPLAIDLPGRAGATGWRDRVLARYPAARIRLGGCPTTTSWLADYFEGETTSAPWPHSAELLAPSAAHLAIWQAVHAIPYGERRSYDALAVAAGLHPRQVGQLVGANPLLLLIPCHRVVGKQGDLVGYAGGLGPKQWLLDHELRSAGLTLSCG